MPLLSVVAGIPLQSPDTETPRWCGAVRVAVAVGFEPTEGLHPHTLSRRAP